MQNKHKLPWTNQKQYGFLLAKFISLCTYFVIEAKQNTREFVC